MWAESVLDRTLGKAPAAVNLTLELTKRLDDMTDDELRAFRQRYLASMLVTPQLIDPTAEDISGLGDT